MEYLDLLLSAEHWFLFFDRDKAENKATELQKKGFRSKIIKERGNQWTVFQLTN